MLWVDALYEKVRYGGRVVSMTILIAIEPMLEESKDTYSQLFEGLKVSFFGGNWNEDERELFASANW